MTKRVKLPEALGGAEVDAIDADPLPMMIAGVPVAACHVPDVGWVAVPRSKLTDASPPRPPEPEPGAYLARRGDAEWLVMGQGDEWIYMTSGGVMSFRWPEWCEQFPGATLTRLVPAPEPVTLPWMSDGRGLHVYIDSGNVAVRVAADPRYTMRPDTARAMAAALLSAADEAGRGRA